jgi:hypothetical protein
MTDTPPPKDQAPPDPPPRPQPDQVRMVASSPTRPEPDQMRRVAARRRPDPTPRPMRKTQAVIRRLIDFIRPKSKRT